jgi:Fe-S cluster assembly scaffold protein SufB
MNCTRRLYASLIGLTLIVPLTFATQTIAAPLPDGAQSARQIERERVNRIMDPATNVEEFRLELNSYLTELTDAMLLFNQIDVVRKEFNRGGLRPVETLARAQRSVAELSTEDLIAMRAAYAKAPGWREQPNKIRSLLNLDYRQQVETGFAAQEGIEKAAAVADSCADGINAGITNTDIAIADAFRIAAEAIQDVIPAPFNFVAVAATAATKGVVLALQTLKNIKDDCEGDAFEAAIQTQIADSTTTIISAVANAQTAIVNNDNSNTATIVTNANTNTANIIANDNTNRALIIANENANAKALTDLLLRTQIEADLAEADSATSVGWYLTPTGNGGHLNLVQAIVTETLANVLAAGGSIGNAQSFLNRADADKAAGNFKSAYDNYRKAYKAAVN